MTDMESLAERRRKLRAELVEVNKALRIEVVKAKAATGATEVDLARDSGVDRMTIRSWLGKGKK